MEQYIIKGGNPLVGEVEIGGAKNASLAILAAAVMTDETVLIENITTENVTEKINTKLLEMEKQSYKLVTMSFLGTEKAVLVFKKGLKGSLL